MAKKFLYLVATIIVLILAGALALTLFSAEITRFVMVPDSEFTPQEPLERNAYEDPSLWYSRPGIGTSDPARWQPAYAPETAVPSGVSEDAKARVVSTTDQPDFAVFFVHPTSYRSTANWNAPLGETDDPDAAEADKFARIFLRGMASPFNAASEIWAPRYRQATMGAFLTNGPEGGQALDAAYADVREAFRYFLDSVGEETPIVLAGHSQGALHLMRLLAEEVQGSPAAGRLVAAYVIGWPISLEHDLPAMGVPACATANQTGCVLSWSSFAAPADPSAVLETYAASTGLDGEVRGTSEILCTNPITGRIGGSAPANRNLGTLKPDESLADGELVPGAVPATCEDRGLLMIGPPPEMGALVLPGNNYHVYDIPLFWANTKVDVARRVQAFAGEGAGGDTAN
ncbi:DUF3089 domain-containing protein [Erythrobacter sp.]|jgi:hypothetical protein|uniref:DUF3089 domain-containing protein n=1 Tax=Erythrobacter sp. TaxID=1042 RepID=UPI002EA58807|nr:DUF3089 domain-containing protein [Erythrobacter sp.]